MRFYYVSSFGIKFFKSNQPNSKFGYLIAATTCC